MIEGVNCDDVGNGLLNAIPGQRFSASMSAYVAFLSPPPNILLDMSSIQNTLIYRLGFKASYINVTFQDFNNKHLLLYK